MKKILYAIFAVAIMAMASCSQDEPEMTATQPLAGQWYVTMDGVDNAGNVTMDDPFGVGRFLSLTFNTAANVPTEMWVSDIGNFWGYQVKVKCDVDKLTFATDGAADNTNYDPIKVTITEGKILKGQATTPSGMPADSIVYYIQFEDDQYIGKYWDKMRISGYRYTGFVADDDE